MYSNTIRSILPACTCMFQFYVNHIYFYMFVYTHIFLVKPNECFVVGFTYIYLHPSNSAIIMRLCVCARRDVMRRCY